MSIKWSPILHWIAFLSALAGVIFLASAWMATANGTFLGFSEEHLFNDAKALLLISIAFGIGTLIHQNEER